MIDLKQLREDPQRFKDGAAAKNIAVDIDRFLALDEERRRLQTEQEQKKAEQNRIGKEVGAIQGRIKKAEGDERAKLEQEAAALRARPAELKREIQTFDEQIATIQDEHRALLLQIPQPPDPDVPKGASADDNVEKRIWAPGWFDPTRSFLDNKGFEPRSHIDLMTELGMVDFERAVKMSGARHYVMRGDGMRLYQAVLRFALDLIVDEHGFTPLGVPVLVREECMVGTGFFPSGRDQAYQIDETRRGAGQDLYLTGTGEVSLMGFHGDEILDADMLPLKYATVSTCFRREAGAAGKDTAGLYRIHQFDKVEQVVICRADEEESRQWHDKMIKIVEELLRKLELPYRLLQCCTADLGPKNADMIDLECWMPSRGAGGAWGETHSASRLYDFQCRRLKLRYRDESGNAVFCHSLNNTVAACPRILIPIIELYQNEDGSITVPPPLRPYMNGQERIESRSPAPAAAP
jgi:seryl-tRNA synthetase